MKTFSAFFLTLTLLFAGTTLFGQTSEWKEVKRKDGIVVHTRTLNGSKFKEFKARATFQASLHTVMALILDTKKVDKWYHQATNPMVLKNISDTEGYYRLDFDLPWPVDDRDAVVHWVLKQNPSTKEVRMDMTGVADYAPKQDDLVRITKLNSVWIVTPKGGGKVEVFHQAHVEPGGSVPAWLANSTVTDGPLNTFTGMKSRFSSYSSVKLPFIEE